MPSRTIEYYEDHSDNLAQRYENADISELHERLLNTFSPGSSLLEIGCGTGREAAFLLDHGYDIDCIESSGSMITRALEYHPKLKDRIIRGEVPACLASIDKKYDGIYAIATLMHLSLDDIPIVFGRLKDLLKNEGRILISVPLSRPDLKTSGYDPKGRYFLLLDEKKWCDLIGTAGFTEIETSITADGMGRGSVKWLNISAIENL